MIPIVLACDDNYVIPTCITIISAIKNKSDKTKYEFYILSPTKFSYENQKIIDALTKQYNVIINIIRVGEKFKDVKMKISHITVPTYYRLCLPQLLFNEKKCIYLDSDVIVRNDLTELYDTYLDDYSLAGVFSEGIKENRIYAREHCRRIGLKNVENYINAGVLVMNLEKLRQDNMMNKWIELVPKAFPAQDQDILNLSCYGKIKIIPLKYNAMTKCRVLNSFVKGKESTVYSGREISEAYETPVIIHYADRVKPWNSRESFWANYWWEIVDEISIPEFAEKISDFSKMQTTYYMQRKENVLQEKIVKFSQILGIYGYLKRIEDALFKGGK